MESPCIGCKLKKADKNNPTCRECSKRVEYVTALGGMTHSVPEESISLKQNEHPTSNEKTSVNIRGKNSKGCLIEGCDEDVYCRGLCLNHYQQWYKGYIDHPILGKYKVAQPKKNRLKEDKKEQTMNNTEGTKTKLIDLNNHMFAQLERLSDVNLDGDRLAEEIRRSHAIASVAGQIISNAGLALKAQMAVNELLLKDPPKMLGVEGFDERK